MISLIVGIYFLVLIENCFKCLFLIVDDIIVNVISVLFCMMLCLEEIILMIGLRFLNLIICLLIFVILKEINISVYFRVYLLWMVVSECKMRFCCFV